MTQQQIDRLWRENQRLQEIIAAQEITIANYEKWLQEMKEQSQCTHLS